MMCALKKVIGASLFDLLYLILIIYYGEGRMKRLIMFMTVVVLAGCQAGIRHCPTPETVRLRKASFNRMRWYQTQLEQRTQARKESMAKREQLLMVSNREQKKASEVEEWDCPRPGTQHERLIRKSRKKMEKQQAQNLKKRTERFNSPEASPSVY
jgi:hypothetical protein